jgi:hypothetical protein
MKDWATVHVSLKASSNNAVFVFAFHRDHVDADLDQLERRIASLA